MTAPPRLSLIIPAKDEGARLATTFGSLRQQFADPADLQVIFVDDGSSDDTAEVVETWAPRFPHFDTLRHETPHGLADSRNDGLALARADHIAFLDGDDWLRPGHLAAVHRALTDLDVDFVRCDHTTVTGGARSYKRAPMSVRGLPLRPRAGILPAHDSTMIDYPYAWAGGFHRRLLDDGLLRFPAGFQTAEDRSWIWDLHLHARSFAVIDAPGICYRRGTATSLTQIYDRRQLDFTRAFQRIFDLVVADAESQALWPKAARNWLAILQHHVGRLPRMEADVRHEFSALTTEVSHRIPADVLRAELRAASKKRFNAVLPYLPDRFAHLQETSR
ncbi:MAG TPA: glycosyltransferase family 2 protein [Candidatus Brevibacterium intestinigallinarum]|nr:glycosyltransferase family 2 protein [Candidatus Brevibacterium intestinigallinarum]